MSLKLTEAEVQNCTWRFVGIDGHYRVYIGHGTHPATGVEITVEKREPMFEDDLVALNTTERNERDGRRWSSGMGSEKGGNVPMVHVARIPLNKFFADRRHGDKDHDRWLLNSDEYKPFRTRTGDL